MPGWQPNCGNTGENGRVTRSGSDDRRLIRRSGVLLAATAALGLGAAAVGVRAATGAALRGTGLATGAALGLGILFALVAALIAAKYRDHVRSTEAETTAQDRLRQATTAVLFASAVLVPFALLLLSKSSTGEEAPSSSPIPSLSAARRRNVQPLPTRTPSKGHGFSFDLTQFVLGLVTVIAAALLVSLIVVAIRLLRKVPVAPPTMSVSPFVQSQAEDEALADALLAGRSALAGADARVAIIACYAAMEDSLAQVGVVRERSDSPSDLLRRAARDLPEAGARNAATLTDLFREARFSSHPMTSQHLDAARSALDTVTSALSERIRAQEAEAQASSKGSKTPVVTS
jgi:hypothetical protein